MPVVAADTAVGPAGATLARGARTYHDRRRRQSLRHGTRRRHHCPRPKGAGAAHIPVGPHPPV